VDRALCTAGHVATPADDPRHQLVSGLARRFHSRRCPDHRSADDGTDVSEPDLLPGLGPARKISHFYLYESDDLRYRANARCIDLGEVAFLVRMVCGYGAGDGDGVARSGLVSEDAEGICRCPLI